MNRYEKIFFGKFIPEGNEVKYIVHEHIIVIFNRLIILFGLFVFIPTFFYYVSVKIQGMIPFYVLEIYLILIYFKIIYDIFNWYNDAWIITTNSIIDFKWALFWIKSNSVDFESIEGIEVEQNGIFDKVLGKGTITIHKMGDETFILNEALIPFEALEEIEKIKEEHEKYEHEEHEKAEKTKFELIMDALSGVVGSYLDEKGLEDKNKKKQDEKHEKFIKIKEKKGTIDLRFETEEKDDNEEKEKHSSNNGNNNSSHGHDNHGHSSHGHDKKHDNHGHGHHH